MKSCGRVLRFRWVLLNERVSRTVASTCRTQSEIPGNWTGTFLGQQTGDFKRAVPRQMFRPRWPPLVSDHSTSRVARVERALFPVAPGRFSPFVDAHEAIAMALAGAPRPCARPARRLPHPRARRSRGTLSLARARASPPSAASRLGARPAAPAPLARALRFDPRARGDCRRERLEDDGTGTTSPP